MNPTRAMLHATLIGILALGVLTGCEKGPAEKAGERIDDAARELKK